MCLRTRHVSFVSRRVRLFNHFNLEAVAVAVAEAETELEIVAVVGRVCCHFWGCRKGDTVSGYALSRSPLSLPVPLPIISHLNFIMSPSPSSSLSVCLSLD